ncbi:MAG: hypothetical protein IJR02_12510 [Bacteroidaceae bacterium]|nr:hypothetical protein [Bacteroidaceae bacterium]
MEKKEFVKPTTRVVELQAPVEMLAGSVAGSPSGRSVNATGLDAGEALRYGGESTGADPWRNAW